MFVRFRASKRRLDVSLIEPGRRDGKPRHEHIASLGSIPQPPSVADRFSFWRKLYERLANLSNRIDAKTYARVLGLIHARIPMATAEEQRSVQLANAEAEARNWEAIAGVFAADADDSKRLVATVEQTVADKRSAAKAAAEVANAAKDRIARIERGESVSGGLGKPKEIAGALIEAGFTKAELRRMRRSAEFTAEDFEAILAEKQRRARAASDWLPRGSVGVRLLNPARAAIPVEDLNASNDE